MVDSAEEGAGLGIVGFDLQAEAGGLDGFGQAARRDVRLEGEPGPFIAGAGIGGLESLHGGGGITRAIHVETDECDLPADPEIMGPEFQAAPQLGDLGVEIGVGSAPAPLPKKVGEFEFAFGLGPQGIDLGPGRGVGGNGLKEPDRLPRHDFLPHAAGGFEGVFGAREVLPDGLGMFGSEGRGELFGEKLLPEGAQVHAVGLVDLGAGAELAGEPPVAQGLNHLVGVEETGTGVGGRDAALNGKAVGMGLRFARRRRVGYKRRAGEDNHLYSAVGAEASHRAQVLFEFGGRYTLPRPGAVAAFGEPGHGLDKAGAEGKEARSAAGKRREQCGQVLFGVAVSV